MIYRHGLRVFEAIGMCRDLLDIKRSALGGAAQGLAVRRAPDRGDELRAIKCYLATREDNLPWLFLSERQA